MTGPRIRLQGVRLVDNRRWRWPAQALYCSRKVTQKQLQARCLSDRAPPDTTTALEAAALCVHYFHTVHSGCFPAAPARTSGGLQQQDTLLLPFYCVQGNELRFRSLSVAARTKDSKAGRTQLQTMGTRARLRTPAGRWTAGPSANMPWNRPVLSLNNLISRSWLRNCF